MTTHRSSSGSALLSSWAATCSAKSGYADESSKNHHYFTSKNYYKNLKIVIFIKEKNDIHFSPSFLF
jgi:hypothetical protein